MTVSVIIPTHNYAGFLAEAINSLRGGTYSDWECVVVDDGSTDDTPALVATLAASDPRIVYVSQAASGPSAARNAGLATASGEFVQFLDADDLLGPRKLQHQLEIFGRHPEADIVYGGVRYFAEDGADDRREKTVRGWVERPTRRVVSGQGETALEALVDDNIMVIESPLIRRSLLAKVGGFDPRIRRMEDWELFLRCALAGAFFLHDGDADYDVLPYVRLHPASSSQDQVAMYEAAVQIRTGLKRQLPTPGLRRLNRKRIHEHWAIIGMLDGRGGRLGHGIRCLLEAGIAERRLKWLAWALLMPLVRSVRGPE